MLIKILVFRCNRRGDQHRGNFIERHIGAASGSGIEDFVKRIAVTVQNARGLELRSAVLQVLHAGQGARNGIIRKQESRPADDQKQNEPKQANKEPAYQTASPAAPPICRDHAIRNRWLHGRLCGPRQARLRALWILRAARGFIGNRRDARAFHIVLVDAARQRHVVFIQVNVRGRGCALSGTGFGRRVRIDLSILLGLRRQIRPGLGF